MKEAWILSAFFPEQDALVSLQSEQISLGDGSPCALHLACCGVGNMTAALFLQKQLLEAPVRPTELLFIGSCGSYAPESAAVIQGDTFGAFDLAVFSGKAILPEALPATFHCKPGSIGQYLGAELDLPAGQINCPGALSLETIAFDSKGTTWTHENLECAGLARVACQYDLPFMAILAVTNAVGPGGSQEWKKNYKQASHTLQQKIKKALLKKKYAN